VHINNDICHYKWKPGESNINAMLGQDSADMDIFQGFSEHQLELLDSAFEACLLPRDTHVFEQGQLSDYLYILTSGKVIIRYKPYDGPPLTVATINPGGVFGWSAALGHSVYSSGALVVEDSQVYRIRKDRLVELCAESPDTSAALLKRLASVVNHQSDPAHGEILRILKDGVIPAGEFIHRSATNGR